MPLGPGKYDKLATFVREKAKAAGVIVIVFDGTQGSGFSVQHLPGMMPDLPHLLRTVADDIERAIMLDRRS